MKLTRVEELNALQKVLKAEGVTVQEAHRRAKSGLKIHDLFLDRVYAKFKREAEALKESKLSLRGNSTISELRKLVREYVGAASPAKLHEAYGGKPDRFLDTFKSGKVRNIFVAIELYTSTKQYIGPAIDSWTAERHFLNQDKGLVKQAREYVKRIGLEFK